MVEDRKRYNYLERTLQDINRQYISLAQEEERRNNVILNEILKVIIEKMKQTDVLFKNMYRTIFYGGSYYDKLRVGHPEEFDLDLLLELPKFAEPDLGISNAPGFVYLQLKAVEKFLKQPEGKPNENLRKLLDDKQYLTTTKVSAWMEGVVNKALNNFRKPSGDLEFSTSRGNFKAQLHKSGPALTLKLRSTGLTHILLDIDLVPCFVFNKNMWPKTPYRQPCDANDNEFFIVPKKPSSAEGIVNRYWRLSFQQQERKLINKSENLKPALKFLKHLRDNLDHTIISSYYIKTIFLWEVDQNRSLFTNNSLSYVFMMMLQKFQERIKNREIPYYWYKNNNLIGRAKPDALNNIANRIYNIIQDIEKHPNDPGIIRKYFDKPVNGAIAAPIAVPLVPTAHEQVVQPVENGWNCNIQ